MLLTLTTTRRPATDLGYLLHKHPERVQCFPLSFGRAYVFYPQASAGRCTCAVLLDVDPLGLVRGGSAAGVEHYVHDRSYVASSLLSVAIGKVFGTALAGRCAERPELPEERWPLEVRIAALPAPGGGVLIRRLFEPLGYAVEARAEPLDPEQPAWGASRCMTVILRGTQRLCDLLAHLYVLIPVLDNDKHYWVGRDEIEKLLRRGEGWLAEHPERRLITQRYLKHQRHLVRDALARLAEEDVRDPDAEAVAEARREAALEASVPVASGPPAAREAAGAAADAKPPALHTLRLGTVLAVLRSVGARRVVDLGCGEGKLLRRLLADGQFERIVGMDVSLAALERAARRLRLDRLPEQQRRRIELIQGSLLYRDDRLTGFDAACCIEVVEHLDPPRLAAFERVVFEHARPGHVLLTTPNREYNVRFAGLAAGALRHRDHRFEWTRAEFAGWCDALGRRFGYEVRRLSIGPEDSEVGPPTQMAVFVRRD